MDENHLAAGEYHVVSAQVYVEKWNCSKENILQQIDNTEPKIPSFVLYPYFEKDVETLREQKFIFKFSEDYLNVS
jgi:hypothetical protein